MSSFSADEGKNRVREAADIVQVIGEVVELKKAGSSFMGRCPFHGEKTPSFSVHPQRQFFHCFGCGESGDVFSFMMKYHNFSFPDALQELATRFRVDLPKPELSEEDKKRLRQRELIYKANEVAAEIYHAYLLNNREGEGAMAYLAERGVPQWAIESFQLGYAPAPEGNNWRFLADALARKGVTEKTALEAGLVVSKQRGGVYDKFRDRIMFPIRDMSGKVVAFGGRILGDGKPKYMNSPETPVFDKSRLLYGLHMNKDSVRQAKRAVVVEGYFDLLMLSVHGVKNVVAPLGTSLTKKHVHSLRGYCDEVVLFFDGDSAGLRAAMRSVPIFLAEQVNARVALLPDGHDPDSMVREQGTEAVEKLVSDGAPLAEFLFDALVKKYGMTLEGKSHIIGELSNLIKSGTESVQRSLMVSHFSEKLGVKQSHFQAGEPPPALPVPQEDPVFIMEDRGRKPIKLSRKQRQLLDFLILYPEFFVELQAAGCEVVLRGHEAEDIINCMKELDTGGNLTPELLVNSLGNAGARDYVAKLLMEESAFSSPESGEEWARGMCDELIEWLKSFLQTQSSKELQEQIAEAQRRGDTALLMELLKRKQEMRKIVICRTTC
ncbi:MAG: DNA primase [Desulfobulbaceae bacterium]|nr:DNA primase [Desulfobulbaceae bacterium]